MKKWFIIILIPFLQACTLLDTDWKALDLKAFQISIPTKWHYKKDQGIDSFVGKIIIPQNESLSFDFSRMGYANHLTDFEYGSQNIKIDTSGEYFIKTIWPKIAGKGITGVYIQSRKSSLNFQINGKDLSKEQQDQALAAFKTIKIKYKGSGEPLPFK